MYFIVFNFFALPSADRSVEHVIYISTFFTRSRRKLVIEELKVSR